MGKIFWVKKCDEIAGGLEKKWPRGHVVVQMAYRH